MRLALIILLFSISVKAQFYNGTQMDFGKNRVQYNDVFWSYYKYKKFNIYFYQDGKELADYTAQSAHKILTEFEDFFDHQVSNKFEIVVYNSHAQAMQSNLGNIGEEQQNNASVTRLLGNKLCIYFDGSHYNFDNALRSGIAGVMLNKVLYGEDIKDIVKNSATTSIPDWFYYGLLSFLSENWNSSINNALKDAFYLKQFENFNALSDENARLAGHAIWKHLADTYGGENILRLIYMTKISHDVNGACLFILGKSSENLINEWKIAQQKIFDTQGNQTTLDENSFELPIKIKGNKIARELKISPNNEWLAYNTNKQGKNKIYLYNFNTKKKDRIFKVGYAIDLPQNLNNPLITWHPKGEMLSIFFENKGEIHWWLYDLKSKKFTKNILLYFSQLIDAEYSPDGKQFVFSAVHKGQSDIYVYDIAARMQEQITNDFYDDLYPQFINGGKQIVFSSNRISDSMSVGGKSNELYPSTLDVFVYNYSVKKTKRYEEQVLRRVSNTPLSNEIYPVEFSNNEILFLSDANGTQNRYIARFDSSISSIDTLIHYRYFAHISASTHYQRNINYLHSNKENVLQIVHFNGKDLLMLISKKEIKSIDAKHNKNEKNDLNLHEIELTDKTEYAEIERYKSRNEYIEKYRKDSDFVDITDYRFENSPLIIEEENNTESNEEKPVVIPHKSAMQHNYMPAFTVEDATAILSNNFVNPTYQRYTGGPINTGGLSPLLIFGTKDLLEDYYVRGGVRLSGLRNNEVFISFENYKKQLDYQYVLYRRSSAFEVNNILMKNVSYEATFKITLPFSIVTRWRSSASLRYDDLIALTRGNISLKTATNTTYRAVLRSEYVFDACKEKDVNIRTGERFKIFGEYFQNVLEWNKNTAILGIDYRKYMPLYKDLILAVRFAGSTSFGTEKLMYFLGGVDGWISPKFNYDLAPSKLQNGTYAFQTLASHLRGFTQNARNGSNFAVINTELRFPFLKMLYAHPISAGWLQHLQMIGFFDTGTGWSGWSPFSEENSLNNKTYYLGGAAQTGIINVKTQRDPLIAGYGIGLRTLLWGYYIRADWAWGIEDGAFKKDHVFYFSLNYDF